MELLAGTAPSQTPMPTPKQHPARSKSPFFPKLCERRGDTASRFWVGSRGLHRGGLPIALCLAALCGCQTTLPARGPIPTDSAELTAYIGDETFVTAEPGYRAVYTLWKGESFAGDFEALSAALVEGRIIGSSWDHAPDRILGRAEVGYMVCRACDIRSGLNWQLTGLGRYAWRELGYLDIAPRSSEIGYVSGGEFLGILSRAEDLMTRRSKGVEGNIPLGPPTEENDARSDIYETPR